MMAIEEHEIYNFGITQPIVAVKRVQWMMDFRRGRSFDFSNEY
jgi:hypothetical protein